MAQQVANTIASVQQQSSVQGMPGMIETAADFFLSFVIFRDTYMTSWKQLQFHNLYSPTAKGDPKHEIKSWLGNCEIVHQKLYKDLAGGDNQMIHIVQRRN